MHLQQVPMHCSHVVEREKWQKQNQNYLGDTYLYKICIHCRYSLFISKVSPSAELFWVGDYNVWISANPLSVTYFLTWQQLYDSFYHMTQHAQTCSSVLYNANSIKTLHYNTVTSWLQNICVKISADNHEFTLVYKMHVVKIVLLVYFFLPSLTR